MKKRWIFLSVAGAILCWHGWENYVGIPPHLRSAWESTSPDGRFKVAGYSFAGLYRFVPRKVGEGPGVIVLIDNKTEEVIRKEFVDYLGGQLGSEAVDWYGDEVGIIAIGAWKLPEKVTTN